MSERSDKFTWGPGDVALPQCGFCRHWADGSSGACAAFPGRIPDEIRLNAYDHRRPWIDPETGEPGDEGVALERSITFEPAEGVHPDALAALYRALDEAAPNR